MTLGIVKIERRGELRAYGDFLLIPMKKERTDTDITLIHARVRLIRRMNALISSLPRLAQDGPIEMAGSSHLLCALLE